MRVICIFAIIVLIYIVQKRIYTRYCFSKVEAKVNFSTSGVFQGEKLKLTGVFFNRKAMPLWWIGVKFNISRNLLFLEEKNENEGNDNYRKDLFFIGSYERITKNYEMLAGKRGYYRIDELEASTGDLFADVRVLKSYPCHTELYVYPALLPQEEFNVVFNRMNGEILTKRHIIEDPFQLRGIREYSPFDSMKTVNWNATARTGELKVNQYDYTASGEVLILVNVERYNQWDPEALVEGAISLASTLCTEYIKNGTSVEIITNGCDSYTKQPVRIHAGNNLRHNVEVYENLARMDINLLSNPIAEIMKEELNSSRKNKVILLISHYHGEQVVEQFKEAAYRGFDIRWIIPKEPGEKIDLEEYKDVHLWEVRE